MTSEHPIPPISVEMLALGVAARQAAMQLATATTATKNAFLYNLADSLESHSELILAANNVDIAAARDAGLSDPLIDRLSLVGRLENIAVDVRGIVALPDPIGEGYDAETLPNGLRVCKRRVPLGVLAIIYESRPNVTVDVAALAIKSGNAVILRGGSETLVTNIALVAVIRRCLEQAGLPADAVQMIPRADRQLLNELLAMDTTVDMVIPRGGMALQSFCKANSRIPVITGGIGICHLYLDAIVDLPAAIDVIYNAKVQRPTVCNALDTLLVHRSLAAVALPPILDKLGAAGVRFHLDPTAWEIANGRPTQASLAPARPEDWSTEWLSLDLNVRVVDDLDAAIAHIRRYSTGHSDGILTAESAHADSFVAAVDSAAVYVNASTRFTDGGQLGLGAEVAISTQKVHARGPMGLRELTSYQWLIEGQYHVRR